MKTQRHKIDFTNAEDLEAVVLAKLGMSSYFITSVTGLSCGQICYRLTKAKQAERLPVGQGYRSQWRNGTSAEARQAMAIMSTKVRKQTGKQLVPCFVAQSAFKAKPSNVVVLAIKRHGKRVAKRFPQRQAVLA